MPMLHDLDFDDWRVLICDDLAAREHSFRLSSERTSRTPSSPAVMCARRAVASKGGIRGILVSGGLRLHPLRFPPSFCIQETGNRINRYKYPLSCETQSPVK